jgi:hypothetical protein
LQQYCVNPNEPLNLSEISGLPPHAPAFEVPLTVSLPDPDALAAQVPLPEAWAQKM